MLWEKDSGMANAYKNTIPRLHRDPSKKKKKTGKQNCRRIKGKWDLEMGSLSPQSHLIDYCSS